MATLALISALTKARVIGKGDVMPWHISAELKYFKKMTMNKPIIMGSNTFFGLGCKLLPGRRTIVLTSKELAADGFDVAKSKEEALDYAKKYLSQTGETEIMIVGGAGVYKQFLDDVDVMYLSWIKQDYDGDVKFPEFDTTLWKNLSSTEYDEFVAEKMIRV